MNTMKWCFFLIGLIIVLFVVNEYLIQELTSVKENNRSYERLEFSWERDE